MAKQACAYRQWDGPIPIQGLSFLPRGVEVGKHAPQLPGWHLSVGRTRPNRTHVFLPLPVPSVSAPRWKFLPLSVTDRVKYTRLRVHFTIVINISVVLWTISRLTCSMYYFYFSSSRLHMEVFFYHPFIWKFYFSSKRFLLGQITRNSTRKFMFIQRRAHDNMLLSCAYHIQIKLLWGFIATEISRKQSGRLLS